LDRSGEKMTRMVQCVKFGRELPGLDVVPVKGELGQRIYDNVSAQAWDLWKEQQVILINHYGLSLFDPGHQKFLREQMEEFFFGEGARMPEGWTPPDTQGGKGGGGKGAPAPQRK
jgi:Fe-S cluster biosynthesis and repair protein YggX